MLRGYEKIAGSLVGKQTTRRFPGESRDPFVDKRLRIQQSQKPVIPREWFLVPLFVVDEVIDKIRDGTIAGSVYDPKAAALTRAAAE